MLKIKLSPLGKKDQRHYRIVIAEGKSKLTGKYLELLGYYNPHDPKNKIVIDKKAYQHWLDKGAQPTPTIKNLINKNS